MTTGEKIKQRRTQLGISQEKLGDIVGVSKATISRYESFSIKKIPVSVLLKISEALNATIYDLSSDEIEPAGDTGELTEMVNEMEAIRKHLIMRINNLSPEKQALVDAFVQGIEQSDPKGSTGQE